MAFAPTVVFDFDGVIHSYKSGWKGAGVIPDPVVPGIAEVICRLREDGYRVVVVSTRCSSIEGMEAVEVYLKENHIVVDDVLAEKPPAVCYVDDRAVCFRGNAGKLVSQIKNFKSWVEDPQVQIADCTEIHMDLDALSSAKREQILREVANQRITVVERTPHPTRALRPCKGVVYYKGESHEVRGWFHGWAADYEEFETGPGNTTYAIIELEDGSIATCPPGTVQFLDRNESEVRE